jgi:preprotein translocase SecE subunit
MADQPAKRAKRLVKNPETFRERAIKASENTDKPRRISRVRSLVSRLLKPVFRPIGHSLNKLFSVQPFKTIAKLARLIGLVLLPVYIRRSWKELRLVSWPTMRQSFQLTYAVLAFAVVFGGAVAGVDYGLDKIFRHILLK